MFEDCRFWGNLQINVGEYDMRNHMRSQRFDVTSVLNRNLNILIAHLLIIRLLTIHHSDLKISNKSRERRILIYTISTATRFQLSFEFAFSKIL